MPIVRLCGVVASSAVITCMPADNRVVGKVGCGPDWA
jgi:hypothetical protein